MIFGVRLSDVACPFRLCRRSVFERMPIQANGPFAHVEMLAKANFLACLMTEAPLKHHPPPGDDLVGPAQTAKAAWAEAFRVFKRPDFGAVVSPAEKQLEGSVPESRTA